MLGIFLEILALFMWRLTGNFLAWGIFFLPGAVYILLGLMEIFDA
jgi:hypothetical protein